MTAPKSKQCGAPGVAGPCILPLGHAESFHEGPDGKCWLAEADPPSLLQGSPTAGSNPLASDLRDRLAEALRGKYDSDDDRPSYRAADAVLPVVEAEIAAAERRRDQAKNRAILFREQARMEHDRAERAERAERERDQALAALTRHAAEAHGRKWRHELDNQAAFDALHRLGNEILASRDRILAALARPKDV